MSTSNTITVKGLGPTITEAQISDFFTFCGKVNNVSLTPSADGQSKTATVEFARPAAIKTAILLTDSELAGNRVTVEASSDALAAAEKDSLAHETESTTPNHGEDISQEYKPRAVILAEYLSHGYVLGDKVVSHGLELDQKHGISSKFTSFVTDLDKKYHIQDKAEATDKAYGISDSFWHGHAKLSKYLDNALSTPTGSKVRSYYSDIVKNASDVHAEARRLADLKKQQEEAGNSATSTSTTAANSAAAPAPTTSTAPPAYEKS
ncbi:RNA-binding protein Vip1 [Sugiyamaella lignohabitans]|uniref:RNA-binding protein Vip1 n=1 Tax=Sugiyamaella lignohabitans TaxID=796027 RepID=A0A167FC49_9ASCO|nr:RNA-binding protein Vip1 [Sugiyamaella lignohabitans]ANB15101.1 RNA-binding protein Vip1 [Sugiyamaella lignohabitans]